MSTTIDERVVQMRFDNKQFENGVQTSLSTLDRLKQGLKLDGAAKGLENVSNAAKNINLTGLSSGIDTVQVKFSHLQASIQHQLDKIVDSAVNAGKKIVSALTIDPIKSGFQEYETQINAVQTILANTESKGKTLEDVNAALDELNKYADQTIYNFTEMTRNIGTFTAAGVDLDTSVSAIKGIANLAAVSGSNAQQASNAMYQLSQALASGTVKLMDWNSVERAGMGGQAFKDALMDTARVHGIAIDSMIESEGSFRETLKNGWLTSEVLTETLSKFTGDLNEEQLRTMGYTEEQIASIIKMGNTANDAATKVKTFTQLFDTLKEAAQSGWTQSWEIIVGDFEEAKELLTNLSDIFSNLINASAQSRNSLLEGWDKLGGRTKAIEALKNAFNAIASVVVPVKEAFREIFPPTTAQQLYNITEGIANFIKSIQLTEEQSEKLKRTFKGLFAVLDIVKQAFGAVWKNVSPLFGGMGGLVDTILDITAGWGDWLVKLDETIKTTDIFNNVIQKVVNFIKTGFTTVSGIITTAVTAVKEFATTISNKFNLPGFEAFHGLLKRVQTRTEQVNSGASKMRDGFVGAFGAMYAAIASSNLVKILQSVWDLVKIIGEGVSKALGGAINSLVNGLSKINFDTLFDGINTLSLGGIALGITKFLKSTSDSIDGFGGILKGVTDILDGVRGCFEAYQSQLKAGALLKIASAIGILAASILVISTIDSAKLTASLGAVTALFADLMVSMGIFNKISGSIGKTTKACAAMITMSAAVAILAGAMKSLSTLDWEGVVKGLVSIAGLSAVVVASAKLMSQGSGQLVKGSTSLVIFAAAIKVLASACKDLSTLSLPELGKGLLGVGVLLGEVSIFLNNTKFSGKAMSTATGILILSGAIKVLASACADFGAMSVGSITKGLGSIAILLAEITAFIKFTGNANNIISTGAALVLMGAAMNIFASAVSDFGSMPLDAIGRGLLAMAGSLGAVTVALRFIPKDILLTGAGLVVVGAVLNILAAALGKMGDMTKDEIVRGLHAMGIALAELVIALNLMNGTLAGSAALLVAASAIGVLSVSLSLLGSMSLEGIIKGLVTVAGAFVILGVAGLVLAPLTPVILALSAAFALMGVGVVAIGAGLLAVGVGLQAMALGFTALAAMGAAGATAVVAALTVIVTGMVALIPTVVNKIGEAIVLFAQAIIAGAPTIIEAVVVIISSIVTALVTCVPQIVDGVVLLLTSALESIAKYAPKIIQSVMDIIIAVLEGIAANLPRIIQAGVDIVVALIRGIGQAIPQLVDAGFKMIIDFINGIADSIRTNTPLLVDAMKNLGSAMIESIVTVITGGADMFVDAGINLVKGFAKGIANSVGKVVEAAKELGASAIESLRNFLGIHSPSKVAMKDGEYTGEGYAKGLDNSQKKVTKSAANLGESANQALLDKVYGGTEKLSKYIEKTDNKSLNNKRDYWSELTTINTEGVETQNEIQKGAAKNEESINKEVEVIRKKKEEKEQTHWEKLLAIKKKGVEASKYESMKLAEFEQEILESTIEIYGKYTDELSSKTDSIMGSMGLFSEVAKREEVSKDTLVKNLNDQINEYQAFANTLATLNARIADGGLKDAINEMGIDSLSELQAINSMTDEELSNYVALYEQKYALATNVAYTQLSELKLETEQQLSDLFGGVEVDVHSFNSIFDGTMESLNSFVEQAKTVGGQLVDGTAQGIIENTSADEAATAMIDNAEQAAREAAEIHSPSGLFKREVGNYLTEGMAAGMIEKKFVVQNASTQLINGALTILRNARNSFVIAGQNAGEGFKEGILSKVGEVMAAASVMANAAFEAAQTAIDSHSPSRKFIKLGQFADEGFVIGLQKYSNKVSDASYKVGEGAINTMSDVLSNMTSIITNDIDTEPTIRPVLDLSRVANGTRQLSTMLSHSNAISVSAGMNSRRELGNADSSTNTSGGNVYNLIQNNNSPKALSRIEIYRQTKNQFSALKEVLET